jgi:hypothetical protein
MLSPSRVVEGLYFFLAQCLLFSFYKIPFYERTSGFSAYTACEFIGAGNNNVL